MIKQLIPQEFCLKCQGCCRFFKQDSVWSPCLLDEEIQALIDREGIPSASITVDKKLLSVPAPDQDGFICPFLDCASNKCKIYELRPFECQLYPFLLTLRNKKVILTIDLNCPYAKGILNTKDLQEYTRYLNGLLNSRRQITILKDNPQIIQAYEEVLDIIELSFPYEPK